MKLSNLFMIALLAGTLGVLGCGDDTTNPAGSGGSGTAGTGGSGTAGTGGGGGTVTDPCTGGLCVDPSEPKAACELTIEFCKSVDCCEGVNPTDRQCDAFGTALCTLDFGFNPTPDEVCDEYCESTNAVLIQDCKNTYADCLLNPPSGDPGEKCSVIALAQCGI